MLAGVVLAAVGGVFVVLALRQGSGGDDDRNDGPGGPRRARVRIAVETRKPGGRQR